MMKGKFIDKNKQTKSSVNPAFEKSEEKIKKADFISTKKENLADEIEPELRDIAKALEQMDFSEISHKEQIKNRVLENIEDRKRITMKKSRRVAAIAAVAVLGSVVCFQTVFATDVVEKIKQIFNLGHITIVQEEIGDEKVAVPDSLKGKIFDEYGNEITEVDRSMKVFYTKDGEEIVGMDAETGEVYTATDSQPEEEDEGILIEKDQSKIQGYLCFTAKFPEYLPEGYTFACAELYKDDAGKVENSQYLTLKYTNAKGKTLYIFECVGNEETAACMSVEGEIEEIMINNARAVLSYNSNLDWEADEIVYGVYGRKAKLSREEVIKVAESLK